MSEQKKKKINIPLGESISMNEKENQSNSKTVEGDEV